MDLGFAAVSSTMSARITDRFDRRAHQRISSSTEVKGWGVAIDLNLYLGELLGQGVDNVVYRPRTG